MGLVLCELAQPARWYLLMATHGLTMVSSPLQGSVWAQPSFNVTAVWIYHLPQWYSERFGGGSVMSVS